MKVKGYLSALLLIISCFYGKAGDLYMHSFGDSAKPAIIFLHGGPGYNCAAFELSTAAALADSGFFVIVYDSRGCGRSSGEGANYTFDEAVNDLQSVYDAYHLKRASLLGHSFGGAVALKFADKHPDEVSHLILASAPLDYPHTFNTILAHCRAYYKAHNRKELKNLNYTETMDTTSLPYASNLLMNALKCKLYYPKVQTKEAVDIYKAMKKDTLIKYVAQSAQPPVNGFYAKEHYTTLDLYGLLQKDMVKVQISGIFGDEDGLFDDSALERIKSAIGENNFYLIKGASHNVFLDKRGEFIKVVKKIID